MGSPCHIVSMCSRFEQYVTGLHEGLWQLTFLELHTGLYLARRLCEVLREYKISTKVCECGAGASVCMLIEPQLLNITMDSASNNDALVNELAKLLLQVYGGLRAHIRCMDHIVNIAA